jgi:hypothetical protein
MSAVFYKAPSAILDYTINWADALGSGTIASASWALDTGITQASASNTTTTTRIVISGGTVDEDYTATCTIVTAGGLTDVRQFLVRVRTPELLALIGRLRKMVAEADEATYSNGDLEERIKACKLPDRRGENPDYLRVWPLNSQPRYATNPDWIGTYDLHAAAAEIWAEKAAAIAACSFDFRTDAGSYDKSQKYDNYIRMANWHKARRMIKPIRMTPENRIEDREGYIINDEGL